MHDEYTAEEWRPVPGFEGYYSVSSLGRVRSDRAGHGTNPGRLLNPKPGNRGYCKVILFKDAARSYFGVHVLVARAFIGPKPQGMVINHLDVVKTNNRAVNLEYTTTKGNAEHAVQHGRYAHAGKHGRHVRGEAHHQARLTAGIVCAIRSEPDTGRGFIMALARKYAVHHRTIGRIRSGKIWADLHCSPTISESSSPT